jgi:hypothetical protein
MPKLKEAAVLVAGRIIDVEVVTEFGTDKYDGKKIVVATGDGFAQVKLNPERVNELQPDFGQAVAWWVRYGAYANRERQSDAQTYSAFVRVVEPGDLDKIAQAGPVKKAA